jgi:hypothetical protein
MDQDAPASRERITRRNSCFCNLNAVSGQYAVSDVFEFVPDSFWRPFRREDSFTFVIERDSRSDAEEGLAQRPLLQIHDHRAIAHIRNEIAQYVPTCRHRINDEHETEESVLERLRSSNCIVVGSPLSNHYTEIVLCACFGAQPFSRSAANRAKVPLRFVFPQSQAPKLLRGKNSTLIELVSGSGRGGIYLRHEDDSVRAESNWQAQEDFFKEKIDAGRDAGFVIVMNRPLGTTKDVKTIVLGGITSIGTAAAAEAVMYDFRDLEPLNDTQVVIGILEAKYQKPRQSFEWRVKGWTWKYLSGGRRTEPDLWSRTKTKSQ